MPLRYQPGDRVIVRRDLNKNETYHMDGNAETWYYANDEMRDLGGKTVVIKGRHMADVTAYSIQDNPFVWTDEMFEGLEEDEAPIPEAQTDWDQFDW